MPYVLLYQARNNNRWFWTADQKFTSKKDQELMTWQSLTGLYQDFDNLKQDYPTRFGAKRADGFFALNLQDRKTLPLSVKPDQDPEPMQAASRYVITVKQGADLYYFRKSTKTFVKSANANASIWEELNAPIELAEKILQTKTIWNKQKKCDPSTLRIYDLTMGAFVWDPATTDQHALQANSLYRNVRRRIARHLANSPRLDDKAAIKHNLSTIDLDLEQILAALDVLIDSLQQKTSVDHLLNYYDKSVTQDLLHTIDLHTIELTDTEMLDASKIVSLIKETRVKRRRIKDLSIFLTALANSFDVAKFLTALETNPSYGSSYSFKDKDTADIVMGIIRQQEGEQV